MSLVLNQQIITGNWKGTGHYRKAYGNRRICIITHELEKVLASLITMRFHVRFRRSQLKKRLETDSKNAGEDALTV
jgi:hypothetical protein